jgi:hypothetical protein
MYARYEMSVDEQDARRYARIVMAPLGLSNRVASREPI